LNIETVILQAKSQPVVPDAEDNRFGAVSFKHSRIVPQRIADGERDGAHE
jgi:hypothetical protein